MNRSQTFQSTITDRLRAMIPRPLRRLLRTAASIPDRLGHGRRRRRAVASLDGAAGIRRILVLCHGNICRSPFVAVRLQQAFLANGAIIESAGFLAGGRASPIEARDAAQALGVPLDDHRSRQVTTDDLALADLVIVMEPVQRDRVTQLAPAAGARTLLLGELDPIAFQTAEVPDPWGRPPDEFARCYARLDRCTAELIRLLQPSRR